VNLQQLTTFCTVISEGNMTAAAEKLFLTQPAVSQQIRNLEEELGVELLERGVRKVKPTLQGQLLYDYAKRILQLTQQAEVAIQTMSQELSGPLSIATKNSIGLFLLSPVLGLFLRHNPKLNIRLVYDETENIMELMRNDQVDMTILPDLKSQFHVEFDHYEKHYLLQDEIWLAGSGRDTTLPKHIELHEFTSRPIIYYSSLYPGFKQLMEDKFSAANIQFQPVFEADNVGTVKRVLETGLGWGFVPAYSIRKQVRTGRLSRIHIEELKFSTSIQMYARKTDAVRKMAEVFQRALSQQAIGN
jgi:DNA-binding transcriptional LysR family regulator